MSILDEFIRLAEARRASLTRALGEAQIIGDVDAVAMIESNLADVEQTLTLLRST